MTTATNPAFLEPQAATTAPEQAPEEDQREDGAAPPAPDPIRAPYGWTKDGQGGWRPKRTRGRRRLADPEPEPAGVQPTLEELKAAGPREERAQDVPPQAPKAERRGPFSKPKAPKGKPEAPQAPAFRAGPIAKGVNKAYRKAGRIVRLWDPELGEAIILCTRKDTDDEDASTVGEAWEELARTNPRIRAFLTRALSTGAWGTLVMAHAPIMLALLMKDSIRRHIPGMRLAEVFLTDDDQDDDAGGGGMPMPSNLADMLGGITPADMAQMAGMFQGMMPAFMGGMQVPRPGSVDVRPPVPGEVVEQQSA